MVVLLLVRQNRNCLFYNEENNVSLLISYYIQVSKELVSVNKNKRQMTGIIVILFDYLNIYKTFDFS